MPVQHTYNERNITEIKTEYTNFLVSILTMPIFEFTQSVYNESSRCYYELKEVSKQDPTLQIGSTNDILKIFQKCLESIPKMNNEKIEEEYNNIKNKSKCADYFDDLVKAVVKSYIILLTFNDNKQVSANQLIKEKYHEKIDIKSFIHKCLIETAREFYNNPYLFWDGYEQNKAINIKLNQQEAIKRIIECIRQAIRKMLPMKTILTEYLNDNEVIEVAEDDYVNIQNLLKQQNDDNVNGFEEVDDEQEIDSQNSEDIKERLSSIDVKLKQSEEIRQQKKEDDEYKNRIVKEKGYAALYNVKKGGFEAPRMVEEEKEESEKSNQSKQSNESKSKIENSEGISSDSNLNMLMSESSTPQPRITKTSEISDFFSKYVN